MPLLRAVVICDLVNSTALIEQLGDRQAAEFMQQLDRAARDLLHRHQGQEIDKTDGFLLLFERPVQAVGFALAYQRLLTELGKVEFLPLKARVGIHVGDVLLWENRADDIAHGAKPVEVEGLAKPVAARLMNLALPGQILMSGVAHSLALRAVDELQTEHALHWRAHGRYRFKGVAEPIAVYEVGEEGIGPLQRPSYSGKAYREIPWWRRPGMLIIEVAALAAAVAVPLYLSLRSPTAIAFGKRDWIVVGDLNNLTDESILNDSLQSAFRIGLEQSRYVNVLSDLKVRDTLELMQRDPEKTHIDRVVGSEVAIRNGARALVLPTVAEIGGRVRVTAEVVDPRSQDTVYSEVAEGVGYGSILPSLDKIGQQLRLSLGEALGSVQTDNAPLPQVTTSNLDALRAYALGLQAYGQARRGDALELFRHAVKLDPDFALAYMGVARVYIGASDEANGRDNVLKAVALKDRLPARDQLYLEAWLAKFGPSGPMLEKWRLLGKLYPDYYAAHYNYAFFAWQLENRAAEATEAIQPALSEHDPMRGSVYYTLGYLQVAQNQFDAGMKSFATAAALGYSEQGLFRAAGFAAQRRFDEALAIIEKAKSNGLASEDVFMPLERYAIHVDKGEWDEALSGVEQALPKAAKVSALYGRVYRAIALSIDDYMQPKEARRAAIAAFITDARKAAAADAGANHDDNAFAVLLGADLAARAGDLALAKSTLESVSAEVHGSGYTNLEHLFAIAQAEIACAEDRCKDAVALLEPDRDGSELYLTHSALADAYQAAGNDDGAQHELDWLIEHRGRAYLEIGSFQILQTRNVAESDLALLRKAEIEHKNAADDQARKHLADFESRWPKAKLPAMVTPRVEKLRAALKLT